MSPAAAPEPVTQASVATTETPQPVATVVRYIPVLKDLKDTHLLFALQVPAEWNVSTVRLARSDTADYRTDLVAGSIFSITSSPMTGSREQEYRDRFRQWDPPPVVTAVTINGIRYERFESSAAGNTTVAYLPRSNCANERGYASVLVFASRDSNRFEKEDFEKVVTSFRYFDTRSAATIPGEEIPLYDLYGSTVPGTPGRIVPVTSLVSDWGDTADSVTMGGSGGPSSASSHSSGCHH